MKHVKSKNLSSGCLRRLSIAEEMVHGPSTLFIDEPITGLDNKDVSIIMSSALREYVNQERTVVVTLHQVRRPTIRSKYLIYICIVAIRICF